ncbi:SGNH hydrolase-type esterase domain-containing protein, partial [Lasiosphaeria miniovina]
MAPLGENVEHRPPLKIMVIGDSISQGREGDWTWRYRIWEWLREEKVPFVFVGPFQGTEQPEQPSPPRPPPLPWEPAWPPSPFRSNGEYARGVSAAFHANSCHFAAGGRQAAQAKDLVAEQVAALQPDLCLVQLGFNDLSWCVSGPEDTLASVKCLVDCARAASVNPGGIAFAIADIPHRTPVEGREDLPANTNVYNSLLARAIPAWRTPESPLALVRFCENYSCGTDTSAGAYDGLHPNALGEYELAQAFSRALVDGLGLGRRALRVPPHIPQRPIPEPANVRATPSPCGVVVTWDPVFGAYGYDVRERLASSSSSSSSSSSLDGDDDDDDGAWTAQYFAHSNRHDTTRCVAGTAWEYRVRARAGDRVASTWSGIVRAVANPQTLPGPARIVTHATAAGFAAAWDPPPESGGDEIDRYGVFWLDLDVPGAFPSAVGVR